MRIAAFLTLVVSVVFVITPSINNGLWIWFWTAPLLTKAIAGCLSASILVMLACGTLDIQPGRIRQRTWRNIAFVSTASTTGLVMLFMVMVASQTPVRDWMLTILMATAFVAMVAWTTAGLSSHRESVSG